MAKMWILSGQSLRGWRPERVMDRMDRPRTSIEAHRPSIKGTKLLFIVIKTIIIIMSGCCLGAVLSWLCDGLLRGFGCFSLTSCCSWHPHSASWAWTSACSPTGALLHCCFPSNLSTTTQGAIVKLNRASPELWECGVRQRVMCTLDCYQCWAVKPRLPWSVNCPGVYWEEGRGGWRVLGSQEVGTMKS